MEMFLNHHEIVLVIRIVLVLLASIISLPSLRGESVGHTDPFPHMLLLHGWLALGYVCILDSHVCIEWHYLAHVYLLFPPALHLGDLSP